MKNLSRKHSLAACVLLFLFTLMGCRDFTTVDRPYQRLFISDFSEPIQTLLPSFYGFPTSLTLRVSGTISKPIVLNINQLDADQKRSFVFRDTLTAGTYANKYFTQDHYSKGETELVVTGTMGTTGNLTIEWYRQ